MHAILEMVHSYLSHQDDVLVVVVVSPLSEQLTQGGRRSDPTTAYDQKLGFGVVGVFYDPQATF